jgi:hypothetical protein
MSEAHKKNEDDCDTINQDEMSVTWKWGRREILRGRFIGVESHRA